jgi:flavodoxin/ferredoxin
MGLKHEATRSSPAWEDNMGVMRVLFGRRQFMTASLGSVLGLTVGRVSGAFDLLFGRGSANASEMSAAMGKRLRGIVVYYSAAGNTAQIAGSIYKGMKSVIPCDVAPVKEVKPADMAKYDVIAIGAPIWFYREPANVKAFTYEMPRMDGKHCILFGTHGTQPIGQFWSMSRNVLRKGMTIIGWSDWFGADLVHGYQPHPAWGHPDSIDLAEAEAFGKRMAEYSIRIYTGETDLIPEIPKPLIGENNLWAPRANDNGTISYASPPSNHIPEFNLAKCVYPRCARCIDNCPVNAIDFLVTAPEGSVVSKGSKAYPLVLKQACQHCGGLCQRVCIYDAIYYPGERREYTINMKKCTHPKCTACLDNCPQDVIDFSVTPPVVHNRCEGGDYICFDVCPHNAIEYPPEGSPAGGAAQQGMPPSADVREAAEVATWLSHLPIRFRPLIRPQDIGCKGDIMSFTNYPRIQIRRGLWPLQISKG